MKMAKRKEIEDAIEGFSYPALKVRRLEPKLPHQIGDIPFQIGDFGGDPASGMTYRMGTVLPPSDMTRTMGEIVPPPSSIDNRAIVLYTPSYSFSNLGSVPSNLSLLISPELLQNLKNQGLPQGNNQNLEDKSRVGDDCLAVVPWVPSMAAAMASYLSSTQQDQNPATEELMESEESTSMEIENEQVDPCHASNLGAMGGNESFHHQWQLHCMAPGTQPNPTSHLMWSQ